MNLQEILSKCDHTLLAQTEDGAGVQACSDEVVL